MGIPPTPPPRYNKTGALLPQCAGFVYGINVPAAKKVKVEDHNKAHYPHTLVMGVDGMTCQNCQRHVENALNTLPDTLAEVNLSAQNEADEDAIRQAIRDAGYLPLRTTSKV